MTQLAKMSFDKIFDLAAGLYFFFLVIYPHQETDLEKKKKAQFSPTDNPTII